MNSVTKLTRFLKVCIYSLGPRRDFIVRTGGKVYTLEDRLEDCKIIGGHIMIINYLEVCSKLDSFSKFRLQVQLKSQVRNKGS